MTSGGVGTMGIGSSEVSGQWPDGGLRRRCRAGGNCAESARRRCAGAGGAHGVEVPGDARVVRVQTCGTLQQQMGRVQVAALRARDGEFIQDDRIGLIEILDRPQRWRATGKELPDPETNIADDLPAKTLL